MLIFYNDKCSKNKCSDVSIFKGKARNVDYMSSCKLRDIGEISCINTSGSRGNGCEHAVHISGFQGFATTWFITVAVLDLLHCG